MPEIRTNERASIPLKAAFVIVGLAAWIGTQWLIGQRPVPDGKIGDYLLDLTAPQHAFLYVNRQYAHALLIVSSTIINLLVAFLLAKAIFGPSIRPFLGLLMLFSLRQICQGLCALPPPDGMIWEYPGFPGLLVTYSVSNDLFFSGHTALAVFGAVELARNGNRWLVAASVLIAIFEATAVLLLRAHYTMDVFAGAVTALLVANLAERVAPSCDRLLARVWPRKP